MNKILAIFKAVTVSWLRSKTGVFFSILFPLILLLVFAAVFGSTGSSHALLYVQNQDIDSSGSQSQLSLGFIQSLNSTNALDLRPISPSLDAAQFVKNATGFFSGNQRVLVIPRGFQSDVLNATAKTRLSITYSSALQIVQNFSSYMSPSQKEGFEEGIKILNVTIGSIPDRNASLIYVSQPGDQSSLIVMSIVTSVADSYNYYLIGARPATTFSQQSVATQRFGAVDFFLPGIIGSFIMTNGVIALTSTATEFKRRGILKRISATPLRKSEWILGNVLSQTLLAVLLTGIMIAVGWALFNVTVTIDIYTTAVLIAGAILFAGIGMTIAGFLTDPEAASGIGNAIAFPMMFLSGAFFQLEAMPSYIQVIAKVLPLTYFNDGLRASMILQNHSIAVNDLTILTLLAGVFLVVGIVVTKWKEK